MKLATYNELTPWYRLIDPICDHEDEAQVYQAGFERAVPGCGTLLELGAGAGNNAFYLKDYFDCTLTDVSQPMLDLSMGVNPDCEHLVGDMRTIRLDRKFDAVLIHDSIVYMTSAGDLGAAIATAFHHTRAGGAAIFAPDCLEETFHESTDLITGDDGQRSLRCLEWSWRADSSKPIYTVDYALLLRDNSGVSAVHDRHLEGLFRLETWTQLITGAGFELELIERPVNPPDRVDPHPYTETVFLARRPR